MKCPVLRPPGAGPHDSLMTHEPTEGLRFPWSVLGPCQPYRLFQTSEKRLFKVRRGFLEPPQATEGALSTPRSQTLVRIHHLTPRQPGGGWGHSSSPREALKASKNQSSC